MLKTIPKSNINQRTFKVHKKFVQTEATNPIYVGELASDGAFESSSAATTNGISNHSLYASIKHKYYRNDGNIFKNFSKTMFCKFTKSLQTNYSTGNNS